jgi:hypothetical protein
MATKQETEAVVEVARLIVQGGKRGPVRRQSNLDIVDAIAEATTAVERLTEARFTQQERQGIEDLIAENLGRTLFAH